MDPRLANAIGIFVGVILGLIIGEAAGLGFIVTLILMIVFAGAITAVLGGRLKR